MVSLTRVLKPFAPSSRYALAVAEAFQGMKKSRFRRIEGSWRELGKVVLRFQPSFFSVHARVVSLEDDIFFRNDFVAQHGNGKCALARAIQLKMKTL